MASGLLILLVVLVVAPPTSVRSTAVSIHVRDATVRSVGKLGYQAGFALFADDERFGGLSGFELTADRRTLVGVSDRGYWLLLGVQHDAAGRLTNASTLTIHPILGTKGQRLSKQWGDAEEVTLLPGGDILVSFEHEHRLARYTGPATLASAREQPLPAPPGLDEAPPNGGVEAMTLLPDGRLLTIGEKPHDSTGAFRGWLLRLGSDEPPHTFRYETTDGFQPTGLALAAGSEILVLERRFSLLTGIAARLVVVERAAFEGAAPVRTRELARFGGEITCDNFEALAARVLPDGRTTIYIGSDDNYNAVGAQRTLLLQLLYDPKAAR